MSGFEVDIAVLRSAAGDIGAAGASAGEIIRTLTERLAALGELWGTDELGEQFAKRYAVPAGQGLRSLTAVAEALDGVAARLATDADTYDAAESRVAGAARQVIST